MADTKKKCAIDKCPVYHEHHHTTDNIKEIIVTQKTCYGYPFHIGEWVIIGEQIAPTLAEYIGSYFFVSKSKNDKQ